MGFTYQHLYNPWDHIDLWPPLCYIIKYTIYVVTVVFDCNYIYCVFYCTGFVSVKNMWVIEQVCVVSDIFCWKVDTALEILCADFFVVQKYCNISISSCIEVHILLCCLGTIDADFCLVQTFITDLFVSLLWLCLTFHAVFLSAIFLFQLVVAVIFMDAHLCKLHCLLCMNICLYAVIPWLKFSYVVTHIICPNTQHIKPNAQPCTYSVEDVLSCRTPWSGAHISQSSNSETKHHWRS